MKQFAVLSIDATDDFLDHEDILRKVDFESDDLHLATNHFETLKMEISNVYLIEIHRQSENI